VPHAAGGHFTLSPTGGFWVAASTIVITLWTSAAPALTYPLYAVTWDLTPTVTTALFAVYPAALVVMLVVFGNVSDYTGRRPTILVGMRTGDWILGGQITTVALLTVSLNAACKVLMS